MSSPEPVIRFRNYEPQQQGPELATSKEPAQSNDQEEKEAITVVPEPEGVVPNQLPSVAIEAKLQAQVDNIIHEESEPTLVPDKPNWDLKRDVEKKLRILAKETQRAISTLTKENVEEA